MLSEVEREAVNDLLDTLRHFVEDVAGGEVSPDDPIDHVLVETVAGKLEVFVKAVLSRERGFTH